MARKMIIVRDNPTESTLLTEVAADDEAQLQERMKSHPDLLPVDEFGMTGPLIVIGRETTLPSGAIDLVALARSGEMLIIEFKTGPQNSDFRAALAQLVDYGSDLWGTSFDEFEATVPVRYFAGPRCQDDRVRGRSTLADAARAIWVDLSDDEWSAITDQVSRQLSTGGFHYVLVAQRFTPTVQRTIQYLNASMPSARFYAVELVRFSADELSAFESRTVIKPGTSPNKSVSSVATSETQFLEALSDDTYRQVVERFFEFCRGQRLRFEWGSKGASIRLPTIDRPEPLTIAWVFPPGLQGWMGLSNINVGFDRSSAAKTPSITGALDEYLEGVAQVPGAGPVKAQLLSAYHFDPAAFIQGSQGIEEAMAQLVQRAGGT